MNAYPGCNGHRIKSKCALAGGPHPGKATKENTMIAYTVDYLTDGDVETYTNVYREDGEDLDHFIDQIIAEYRYAFRITELRTFKTVWEARGQE